MIANVSAHRRANAFAQALEDRASEGTAPEQPEAPPEPAEQGRLVALANGLGELPKPQLDPEVKVVQRAQLVAAMEAMLREGSTTASPTVPEQRTAGKGTHRASPLRKLRPRSRWSKGLAAGGLTVGVAAGAFGGVAAASSDALPGDSLYGLKRGMEDIKLGMADDDADRGDLYLDQASTRLSEARRLMERGRSGDLDHESLSEIRRVLSGMRHDATEGHRLLLQAYERDGEIGPMARLNSFSQAHRTTWNGLRDRLPVQLADVGSEVTNVFDAIDEEVEPLQSVLPRLPETGAVGSESPSGRPSTARDHQGTGTHHPPSAQESSPTGSHSASPHSPGPSGSPSPDGGSGSPEDAGLLGGSAGGLLKPSPTSTPTSPTGSTATSDVPDVTLPPLLPGLLPGLGIDSEDAR
ncbi:MULTISPECIES: DUF5667 domain-containing protein [unclassified Streptomyces]|uniref:DUF5667 domain-containing protein n=1 Tax=unclassified Streptomyces TaxID=2593676 RepID=UPI001661830B|nr:MULTISPECIES: DUF5667 domain-containing protein [unclassified Streptomyces]MBD0709109.1 hypothetical protein [Streptomyces sp. CBMA291]MBD0716281.1 hypothetical protein [Streptomyces sp. CBMA370]